LGEITGRTGEFEASIGDHTLVVESLNLAGPSREEEAAMLTGLGVPVSVDELARLDSYNGGDLEEYLPTSFRG